MVTQLKVVDVTGLPKREVIRARPTARVRRLQRGRRRRKKIVRTLGVLTGAAAFQKVLTSPVTTVVAGTALGAFVGQPVKAFLGTSALVTGIGVLSTSPRARKAAKFIVSPVRRLAGGKVIGAAIEEPTTFLQKLLGLGAVAAVPIATAGIGAAAVLGTQRLLRDRKIPTLPSGLPAALPAAAITTGLPVSPRAIEPLGAVQPEKPIEEVKPPKAVPAVKITNKPEININFRKSRRFINQQILVR